VVPLDAVGDLPARASDDPMPEIDPAKLQQALDELCKGRTTLVVAHRLSTIKNADEIVVISNGRIEEQGSHEELLTRDGIYQQLYKLQFRSQENQDISDVGLEEY
jgi:ABC-type multidrug transport system fused ATPase/permease subunit